MGFVRNITGKTAATAAEKAAGIQAAAGTDAIAEQRAAAERAQGFFEPFAGAAEEGAAGTSFLTDPQERFDFLQNNPLFKLALENANQQTLQTASAGRRLSFGDTLQELSNNVLLSSAPLLATQDRNLTNLLQFGGDIASSQANIETGLGARVGGLTTDIGAAEAGGVVGAANARTAGTQNLVNLGVTAATLGAGGFNPFASGATIAGGNFGANPFGIPTLAIP